MGHLQTLHSHYESGSYTHSVFMNRVRNIKIRLNEEEYKYLNSKYLILPFTSFSAFLRHLIFSKHIEIKYTPSDDNLAMAISARNKQLQNLNNQISKIPKNKEKYVVLFNPKAQKAEQGNASVDAPDF